MTKTFKKVFFIFSFFIISSSSIASFILIPMDESQGNHLKAYGIAYYAIERDVKGKCSRTVLQDTGHSPHKEQPKSVLLALKNFIIGR